jgi:hypothetical protein
LLIDTGTYKDKVRSYVQVSVKFSPGMLASYDMKFIRTAHRNSMVLWLLALSLGLRSLIAPGFMLTIDADSPLGVSITLCGSAGELAVFDDPHLAHGGSDTDQHTHDHEAALWSTSATYVQFVSIDTDHLLQVDRDEFQINYHAPNIRVSHRLQQQPRAPPVSRII